MKCSRKIESNFLSVEISCLQLFCRSCGPGYFIFKTSACMCVYNEYSYYDYNIKAKKVCIYDTVDVCLYICIQIYTHVCVCVYIHIYKHISQICIKPGLPILPNLMRWCFLFILSGLVRVISRIHIVICLNEKVGCWTITNECTVFLSNALEFLYMSIDLVLENRK